ncbi:MAG: hypothetical protein WCI91_03200 [Candidatus Nomurabacteria bacterium]
MEKFERNEKSTKNDLDKKIDEGIQEFKETGGKTYGEILRSKADENFLIRLKETAVTFIKEGVVKGTEEEIISKILKISRSEERDTSGFVTTLTTRDMTQETLNQGIEMFNKYGPKNPIYRADEKSYFGSSLYLNCYSDDSKSYYYRDIEVNEKGDGKDKNDYRNYGVSTRLGQGCISCEGGKYWEEN